MFESPLCEWCEAWDRDVGVVYPESEEGRDQGLMQSGNFMVVFQY